MELDLKKKKNWNILQEYGQKLKGKFNGQYGIGTSLYLESILLELGHEFQSIRVSLSESNQWFNLII